MRLVVVGRGRLSRMCDHRRPVLWFVSSGTGGDRVTLALGVRIDVQSVGWRQR